jgi:hypothetical protein
MADQMYNGTHPKPRPEKLSAQREMVTNAQNFKSVANLAPAPQNVTNTERKKRRMQNKKKKAPVATTAVGAGNLGAAILQESVQSRSAVGDAPPPLPPPVPAALNPQQKYVLEQNHIHIVDKVSC